MSSRKAGKAFKNSGWHDDIQTGKKSIVNDKAWIGHEVAEVSESRCGHW